MVGARMAAVRPGVQAIIAGLLLPILMEAGSDSLAQAQTNSGTPLAQPSNAALAQLPSLLEQKYPFVRALMVVRRNCVVFGHYRSDTGAETRLPVNSITKSVLSILVGIARDKGLLRLDQKLQELLVEASQKSVDPRAREVSVANLLTMTAGFDPGWSLFNPNGGTADTKLWMIGRTMKYSPGEHFRYDYPGADLLALVLLRATGNAAQFARLQLFAPLGIERYDWIADSDGTLPGQSGLRLTASDMAKIGLLYLQRGRWGDRQLISQGYVVDSTHRHNDGGAPTHAGYGYMWWTKQTSTGLEAYFAAGSGSQLIYVVPQRNLVAVLASDASFGGVNFINDVVLPAEATLPDTAACVGRIE